MSSSQYQLAWPPLTRSFLVLAGVLFSAWLAFIAITPLKELAIAHLMLNATTLPSLKLWAVFTHALFPTNFGQLFFDLALIYMFGADMEQVWGRARWAGVMVVALLVGGALGALMLWVQAAPGTLGGFTAPTTALITAYCVARWDRTIRLFVFDIPGKWVLGLFALLNLGVAISALFQGVASPLGLILGGAAVGALAGKDLLSPRRIKLWWRHRQARQNLKIVRTPEDPRKNKDGQWLN
jgi:membrane associated rhomboid family serine protease